MAEINLGAIRFNWKGAYAGGTAYVVDDVVESGGSSYVCILASTGNTPPNGTYWNLMAQGGTGSAATLTTTGDMLYRDGSGLQRLGIGTAGQVLAANSGATAPEWADASGGGVLACYYNQWNTQTSASGTTLTTIFEGANLTLASTSSKVLILADLSLGVVEYGGTVGMQYSTNGGTSYSSITTLDMADTDLNQLDGKAMIGIHANLTQGNGQQFMAQDGWNYLHSPNSTQVRYKIVMAASEASGYSIFNNRRGSGGWGGLSHVTQMEIGV